jgi:hypothetical protein
MKLEDIRTTDLFGIPPSTWYAKWICKILNALTFHWGMFISDDDKGWVITESIGKGVALTRFTYPHAYIYRIKDIGEVDWRRLISIVADYGDYPYDFTVAFKTAIWWLLKHYFGKVIPVVHDKAVNCQELVVLLGCELGVKIIPDDQYPMCKNLEESPYLEYLGEVNQ